MRSRKEEAHRAYVNTALKQELRSIVGEDNWWCLEFVRKQSNPHKLRAFINKHLNAGCDPTLLRACITGPDYEMMGRLEFEEAVHSIRK